MNELFVLWGAHGSGKTTFAERIMGSANISVGTGDIGELRRLDYDSTGKGRYVIERAKEGHYLIEGKRFIDSGAVETIIREYPKDQIRLTFILAVTSPETYIERIEMRGGKVSEYYSDRRNREYEGKGRFVNKLETMRKKHPELMEGVNVIIVDADNFDNWDSIEELIIKRVGEKN
jgi:adenylate kinase family enzyme